MGYACGVVGLANLAKPHKNHEVSSWYYPVKEIDEEQQVAAHNQISNPR